MKNFILVFLVALLSTSESLGAQLQVRHDASANTISVYRTGEDTPILTQNARPDFRPYIHPIVAPDGRGVLTEYSPGYNPHQTGLYWGFTSVNGRDYFHNPGGDYWRRVSTMVLKPESSPTDRKASAAHFDPVNFIFTHRRYFNNGVLIRDSFEKLGPLIKSYHGKDIELREGFPVNLAECQPGKGNLYYATYLREAAKLPEAPPIMLEHLKSAEEYREAADYVFSVARREGLTIA